MSAQHLMWPGTPKSLDHSSSLYCKYHWYWKEDGKEWDIKGDLKSQLIYNCWDIVRTFEIADTQRQVIAQLGLQRQWEETRERHWLALRMMRKGVAIDRKRRATLGISMSETATKLSSELSAIIPNWIPPPPKKGAKLTQWSNSPMQQKLVILL